MKYKETKIFDFVGITVYVNEDNLLLFPANTLVFLLNATFAGLYNFFESGHCKIVPTENIVLLLNNSEMKVDAYTEEEVVKIYNYYSKTNALNFANGVILIEKLKETMRLS
jgi:hypothetical protein